MAKDIMRHVRLNLDQAYIVALVLLVGWALFAYFTMRHHIEQEQQYAQLINLSGKQRMLSQKTAMHALLYYHTLKIEQRDLILALVTQMQQDHSYLLQHLYSPELTTHYLDGERSLSSELKRYEEQVRAFVTYPDQQHLYGVVEAASTLLPGLDTAVRLFERQSDSKSEALRSIEGWILFGTLLTLILEALFIIRPALKRAQRLSKKQSERISLYRTLFEQASEAIMVTDTEPRILQVNPAYTRITGYAPEEVIGKNPKIVSSGFQGSTFYTQMWDQLIDIGTWRGEFMNRRKDGTFFNSSATIFKLNDNQGACTHYVSIFNDVSHFHKHEEQLRHALLHDSMTDLPNRINALERLEQICDRGVHLNIKSAVILLDLDNFRMINERFDHATGDQLLITIASRLIEVVAANDFASRIGNDQFLIIMEEYSEESLLLELLESLLSTVSAPITLAGISERFIVTCSIGVSICPDDGSSVDELFNQAEIAMYHAKEYGKNRFSFYTTELNAAMQKRLRFETLLRKAIAQDAFELHFQPIYRIANRRLSGFETLIRWNDPELGYVPPSDFIPLAESRNLIHAIDIMVFRKAIEVCLSYDNPDIYFSVNVSPRQFLHPEFLASMLEAIGDRNFGGRIVIEITETAIIDNMEHAIDILNTLSMRGILFAIDDFGTGYASFSYLKQLPISYLKIDQSFIADINLDTNDKIIVNAILSIAQQMHISVVAEGIETQGHLDYLATLSCDFGQGYFLGRPAPIATYL